MEKVMHYVWRHRLWGSPSMATVDGRRVTVIDPGQPNNGSGPDFFNAKVKIGDEMWAGNVEIHVRASDWYRHGHHTDPAYDSVILHVVDADDVPVERPVSGGRIPQVRMPCVADFAARYARLVENASTELPCSAVLAGMSGLHLADWISSLVHERMIEKSERIAGLLKRFNGDWEETAYVTLARALGRGVNGQAMEQLALAAPLRFLRKHSDSTVALEAMLFGQAGMLEKDMQGDAYYTTLRREYGFYRAKFGLQQPRAIAWQTSGMRPQSFPHRRVALLAALISGGFSLFSRLLEAETPEEIARLFEAELSVYWQTRYTFGATPGRPGRALGRSALQSLVINVAAPLVYTCGSVVKTPEADVFQDRAMALLEQMPAEDNSIVGLFVKAGVVCRDALTSQALIQLRRAYCAPRKCLYCRIGHRLLSVHACRGEVKK
ncbi:MAG: DUF2851 family protein [Muribaculaceae bacterium]|nr:DUF2851 family protein [Muribaculaceae bacterium]